ncbi:hypothetical protein Bca52824_026391 [Brassica carinata]|uniref:Uncharacterized protein n=1 Tax=Brassica carinata TaxID=52824 RepID=A0A8X7SHX1_BRACI|nr:hypothetical protein Bca52824_026391 [Brassica carinata]
MGVDMLLLDSQTPAFEQERRASKAYSSTDDIGAWIAVSDDGVLHKALASHLPDLHESAQLLWLLELDGVWLKKIR